LQDLSEKSERGERKEGAGKQSEYCLASQKEINL
jgi:hypothetical protein